MSSILEPSNELQRLIALRRYRILDTPPEASFDNITRLASRVFEVPIALISLVDHDRQWFKSCYGLSNNQNDREVAFCAYTILNSQPLIIPDARLDPRFVDNPLVTGEPLIRFYAGAPLQTSDGYNLGSLCVIDTRPRQFSQEEQQMLVALARTVVDQLETRLVAADLARTERLWRESEERYRVITQAATDAIISIDQSDQIIFANPASEKILGYRPDELIGQSFTRQLLSPGQGSGIEPYVASSGQLQSNWRVEVPVLHKDGHQLLVEISFGEFSKHDQHSFIAIIRDITERKQAEENIAQALQKERELSELKSRFISTASHEFRTPLTVILSSAELLQYYGPRLKETEKEEYLQSIQTAVKEMNQLMEEVLSVSKAQAGKLDFQPAPLDLVELCHKMVEEAELGTDHIHSRVRLSVQGEFGGASLDQQLLRRILSNLLSNALKYSPAHTKIDFRLSRSAPDEVLFEVQDQGIGIPLADQTRLFEVFHRATNVGLVSGTGLGLSIVKNSVDLHQGQISFQSHIGSGSLFQVRLPLALSHDQTGRDNPASGQFLDPVLPNYCF